MLATRELAKDGAHPMFHSFETMASDALTKWSGTTVEDPCVLCDNQSRPGLLLCEECADKYEHNGSTTKDGLNESKGVSA